MKPVPIKAVTLGVLFAIGSPAIAQADSNASFSNASMPADAAFERFQPKTERISTTIDYAMWDEALEYFVFRMGRSIREGAPSVDPGMGTRRVYGHQSRFRLEGNRVIFSYLEDEVKTALTEYRRDLENTGSFVDIAKLSRNEQLAFWINLHNVAVIEQIALEYPVSQPSRIRVNGSDLPLDETPFITVAGISMSPKDIRTKIVFPNWKDPKVIYGFFRGEIGGPSIMPNAFNAANVGELLDDSAYEFVNSLRGTQKNGSKLDISEIYEEARPYFFSNWEKDVKTHLLDYSNDQVTSIIENSGEVRANVYESDVSDLTNGERDPNYGLVMQGDRPAGVRVPSAIVRLLTEHNQKVQKIIRRSDVEGRVTVINVGDLTKDRSNSEVD